MSIPPSPQGPPFREIIASVQEQMHSDFERKSAVLPHAGEKGSAREDVLRSFLADYLPGRFGVAPGFIVDAKGSTSKQLDVVIYDKASCPVFKVSETTRLFPIECVAGVVSVKSYLSKAELTDATDNLMSVLALDRFASERPYVLAGGVMQELVPGVTAAEPQARLRFSGEPLMTAIFAYASPELPTVAANFRNLNVGIDPQFRTQLVTILNKGVISWVEGLIFEPSVPPAAKPAFFAKGDESLVLFYSLLTNQVLRRMPFAMRLNAYLSVGLVDLKPA